MRNLVMAIVIGALGSCETTPPTKQQPIEDVEGGLAAGLVSLKGQMLSSAVTLFGYPDTEQMLAGNLVDQWNFSQLVPLPFSNIPMHIACTVQVGTDGTGTIVNTYWTGDYYGCSRFSRKFPTRWR